MSAELSAYLMLILVGFLPSDLWRLLGVVLAGGVDEQSELLLWVRAVAVAVLAGVIAKLALFREGRHVVAINMSAVERIDFVCAGALLNSITNTATKEFRYMREAHDHFPLTPALSLEEKGEPSPVGWQIGDRRNFEGRTSLHPLPEGEGRGEGEQGLWRP